MPATITIKADDLAVMVNVDVAASEEMQRVVVKPGEQRAFQILAKRSISVTELPEGVDTVKGAKALNL